MKISESKYIIFSEILKIIYNKASKIVLLIILVFQPLMAYFSSKQILSVGLDATPETNNSLVEAIPPVEYIGFDTILLGLFAMIILGAILGGMEFKNNSLRTSLLLYSDKGKFFTVKLLVLINFIFLISFLSIFLSISFAQLALGNEGINPLILSWKVWYLIFLSTISWTLLTILSYAIAFYFKSPIVALLFLLPQVYNLGDFLAGRIYIAKFLPVALGQELIATSPTKLSTVPAVNIVCLSLWGMIIAVLAYHKFIKSDIGE